MEFYPIMTENSLLAAGAALAILILVSLIPLIKLSRKRAAMVKANNCKPAPHFPHKDPILGLDYFLRNAKAMGEFKLLETNAEDFKKFGSTFQVTQFGREVLMTKDWQVLRAIMSTDFANWGVQKTRLKAMRPVIGRNFFLVDGHEWKYKRAQSRPALAKSEYGDLDRFEKHVSRLLKMIPHDGSTIQMSDLFIRLMQTQSTEYFLGETVDMMSENITEEHEQMQENVKTVITHLLQRTFLGDLNQFLPMNKKFAKACQQLKAFVDKNIARAMNRTHGLAKPADERSHRVFLDDMIAQTSNHTDIRDAALSLYIAGVDTTSGTLTGVMFTLSRYPEVVSKMREEILEVCGDSPPDLEALSRLKYSRAAIHECMRLYGVTNGLNFRNALNDTILPRGGGEDGESPLFVKKGTGLIMDYMSLHRDPETWGKDADVFRPERHLEASDRPFYALQLFGGGPRNCPGQNLAFTNTCYVTTRLLQEFKEIHSRDDKPWTEMLGIATANKNGALVGFTPA